MDKDALKAWIIRDRAINGPYARMDECPYAPMVNGRLMKCVRPGVGHRCGDGFLTKQEYTQAKANAPFYAVYSSWSQMKIPPQQLSLIDPPRIEWDNSTSWFSRASRKRQWWSEIYFCKYGRDFAISLSKKQRARRIHVDVVRRKPGYKKQVITKPYMFCG
ncbi:MAG: hypothetical protein KC441_17390 [Anaerolineales bacterium]|nr:hypothetical protein [Anaerolineales bacterium]